METIIRVVKKEPFKTAEVIELVDGGEKISTSAWKQERKELERLTKVCDLKMNAYKEELGKAEKIQKALDELLVDVQQVPIKNKVVER